MPKKPRRSSPAELVTAILENYAAKGVFRGFSVGPASRRKAFFKLVWHHDRQFELILDVPKRTLRFPLVLPQVPADSTMYREFKVFLASRQAEDLPTHRRVDSAKARLHCTNRGGNISVSITAVDGDFEYAARKLIHTVHEVFLVFLQDGPYYEYLVEQLGLEEDKY